MSCEGGDQVWVARKGEEKARNGGVIGLQGEGGLFVREGKGLD